MTWHGWPWALLGLGLPGVLWMLVPAPQELASVTAQASAAPEGANEPFDMAKPAGIARLRAFVAVAPDRLEWRRALAQALEDAGRPVEALVQWRRLANNRQASSDDLRVVARELIGHGAPAEGVALLEALAKRGRLESDQLLDAAEQAGAADLWPATARLLGMLAATSPSDPDPLELLARVLEQEGEVEPAIAAWRKRFELPGGTAAQRLAAVALLERAGRPNEALALLSHVGAASEVSEWRERASLAWKLGRGPEETEARWAIYHRVPGDQSNRLALADRLLAEGDHLAAQRLYDEALANADNDPDTVTELAARRLDGPAPEEATPLLATLAAMPNLPDRALEVLADGSRAHDPAGAAAWLDQLHRGGGGNPATWLARGDLARRLGDGPGATLAWRRVLALVPEDATDVGVQRTRAKAQAALATWPGGRVAGQPHSAIAGLQTWAAYYGPSSPKVPLDRLQQSDLLVLEPDQAWNPRQVRRAGQHVLAYLSLGEIHRSRPYFSVLEGHPGVLASPNPQWPQAVAVDPRSPAWWGVVLEKLVPRFQAQGYDGLFLDTLDAASALEAAGGHPGAAAAMASLVQALRARFPHLILVGNGGLALLPTTAPVLDAVAVESVFTDYQFQPGTYRRRAPAAAYAKMHDLETRLRPFGLPVLVLEYVDPANSSEATAVAEQVRGVGWVPFIGTIGLDALPDVPVP